MINRRWFFLFALLLCGLLLLALFQLKVWDEEFRTEDGGLGTARFTDLNWRYWGSPHVLSAGGGAIFCHGNFSIGAHQAEWNSVRDERVFTVQFSKSQWHVISLDRTDGHKWVIRFYSGKDGEVLQETAPHDHPIRLAIQNLWLQDHDVKVYSAFSSEGSFARSSLLAATWWKIVHSEDVEVVKRGFIEEIAAREFPGRKSFLPPG
jgi:hypothetical protein